MVDRTRKPELALALLVLCLVFSQLARAQTATIAPATLNFGTIQTGTTAPAQTVTLTNTGSTTITLATRSPYPVISGAQAADFSVSASTCTSGLTIIAGGSCTSNITFTPSLTTGETAQLRFPIVGMVTTPALVSLIGRGSTTVTQYYATPGGNDSHAGTSLATAWQHNPVCSNFFTGSYTPSDTDVINLHVGNGGPAALFSQISPCILGSNIQGDSGGRITVQTYPPDYAAGKVAYMGGLIATPYSAFTQYAGSTPDGVTLAIPCNSPGDGSGLCNLMFLTVSSSTFPFDAMFYGTSTTVILNLARRPRPQFAGFNNTLSKYQGNPMCYAGPQAAADTATGAKIIPPWSAGLATIAGLTFIVDSNGNIEVAGTTGTTSGSAPTWPTPASTAAVATFPTSTNGTDGIVWTLENKQALDSNRRAIVASPSQPCDQTGVSGMPYLAYNQGVYPATNFNKIGHTLFDVTVLDEGEWTADRRVIQSIAATTGGNVLVTYTGPSVLSGSTSTTPQSGTLPNHWFEVDGPMEFLGVNSNGIGTWVENRCPLTPHCTKPDTSWNIWVAYAGTEFPQIVSEYFYWSQMNPATPQIQISDPAGNSYTDWTNVGKAGDNYLTPPQGRGDSTYLPLIPAAELWRGASANNILDTGHQYTQISGGVIDLQGTSNMNLVQLGELSDDSTFGIRIGPLANQANPGSVTLSGAGCPYNAGSCTVSSSNLTYFNTVQQEVIHWIQQTDPGGEPMAIASGNSFWNIFSHNTVDGVLTGCFAVGVGGLNRNAVGTENAYEIFLNVVDGNNCSGRIFQKRGTVAAYMNDFGAYHGTPNLSLHCPLSSGAPTAWPLPSVATVTSGGWICTTVTNNYFHHMGSDFNTQEHGGAGGYNDQGASNTLFAYNTIDSMGQDGLYQKAANVTGGTSALYGVPQYNLYYANFIIGAGASEYATNGSFGPRVIGFADTAGENQGCCSFWRNVFVIRGSTTYQQKIQGIPANIGCFDYLTAGNPPIDCYLLASYTANLVFDIDNPTVPMRWCATSASCGSKNGFLQQLVPPYPWGPTLSEDVGSLVADPGIANATQGEENWTLTNAAALRFIGFPPFSAFLAGATLNTLTVPAVANAYSDQLPTIPLTAFYGTYSGNPMISLTGVVGGGTVGP